MVVYPGLSDEEWNEKYGIPSNSVIRPGASAGQSFHGGGYQSCYVTHKPLLLGNTGLQIHGGSCSSPVVKDADVYIGFDSGMRFTARHWPWTVGTEILFRISDGRAPDDTAAFRQLVDWTADQLHAGKKVHCGCIGGHGRTGTFLAALLSVVAGEVDAITYVREHYCKKAVETAEQVKFLQQHYGILETDARRSSWTKPARAEHARKAKSSKSKKAPGGSDRRTITPMFDTHSIWGAPSGAR